MKMLYLKLRGAIGIRKGLGRQEIFIPFSKPSPEIQAKYAGQPWFESLMETLKDAAFKPGLVAIKAKNGSGKTTILDNMHTYRTMVSRDGALESHFYHKDSGRFLGFELDGKIYESKIIIDAVSGGSEAYMYENGEALNDGKLKTYDAVNESICGPQELFFNSVFSGQKSKGIAQLKAAERRKLFYELLNLNEYEVKCERAKAELKTAESNLYKIEADIASLTTANLEYGVTEDKLQELLVEKDNQEQEIKRLTESIEATESEIRKSELEIVRLQGESKRNAEFTEQKRQKTMELNSVQENYKYTELPAIERERKARIEEFDGANIYNGKIQTLLSESEQLKNSESVQIAQVDEKAKVLKSEQVRLCSDKDDYDRLIVRDTKLLNNRAFIETQIQQSKDLTEKRGKLQADLNAKNQEISSLTIAKGTRESMLAYNRIELNNALNSITRLGQDHIRLEKESEALKSSHEKEVARIKADMDMIPRVACTGAVIEEHPELKGCIAVKKAYESAATLPDVLQAYEAKVEELDKAMAEIRTQIDKMGEERKKLEDEFRQGELALANEFTSVISKLQIEISQIEAELATVENDLALVNKNDWTKLLKESQEAESEIKLTQEKVSNVNDRLCKIEEELKECEARKEEIRLSFCRQADQLAEQVASLRQQREEARAAIEREFDVKASACMLRFEETMERLEKEIEELGSKIDRTLQDKIYGEEKKLNESRVHLGNGTTLLNHSQKGLVAIESDIAAAKAQLQAKEANLKKIETLRPKLENAQQQVKEWAFLVKALDKTGIPVLKLENSGYEITSITNDLLSIFDNKFRIRFETTKLTADKKKLKEVFDINVIEPDGECEISNKSGGEKVWIETGLRLAVSRVVRKQGKNIQTMYLDESDGALDMDNAYHFYEMLRVNHNLSRVYNTFLITHRSELLDFIPQKIILENGELKIEAA